MPTAPSALPDLSKPSATAVSRTDRRAPAWPGRRTAALAALAVTAALLAGCSVLPEAPQVITYDLGPAAAAQPSAATTAAAPAAAQPLRLRVLPTDGPARLEGNAIFYRLGYAQPQRLQPYATQRWIESPVRLVDERLRDAVSRQGALLGRAGGAEATLRVELLDFEQIFVAPAASRGLVRVRATLIRNGQAEQRVFAAERPAPTPDAAGGVQALAEGSDEVIAQMLQWAGGAALGAAASRSGMQGTP
ncbi:ABC-type transport auxiliary lipoprotein family protein [Cupriavidus sp. AU9028]|uniref:ABC-type transport auxiliary lipoprotein family protein n=1 Tax=Cupriavidus sp. AU9028 TaxID=2871157 RepID=UPI001C95882F|nr:ABC-type transport auxiliary lipoprotein family protein [Cupriavidus sp. AU9028]MBY4896768.1 PqiC family protein [Cupriavidus sp. AU9028]